MPSPLSADHGDTDLDHMEGATQAPLWLQSAFLVVAISHGLGSPSRVVGSKWQRRCHFRRL